MSVTVKPMQLVIAKDTDAAVFSNYKGMGVENIVYAANKVGESLGQATGLSFPGTGVDFEWVELVYVVQTSSFFGVPQFERRLGYTPSTHVTFQDPKPTATSPTDSTSTGSTSTGTGSTTGTTPTAQAPDIVSTKPGQVNTPLTGNEKVIKESSGLPAWAKYVLIGLGAIAVFLGGFAISRASKKGGKK